jgi:hypothetical protein
MQAMELKKFRNRYDLELIPASHEGIILGTLVWDPIFGKPAFEHPGMPDHIYNAFFDAGIIKLDEWQKALEAVKNEDLKEANLAIASVDINIDLVSSIDQPLIGELESALRLKSLKKFSFGELKVRLMSPLLRVQIDDYLEKLKSGNWKYYDGKIRRVFMITELYYGSVKIVIDKDMANDFTLGLKKTGLKINKELELGTAIEYSFKHKNVPFAMKLEMIKGFTS